MECWVKIYNGSYEISSLGRVKSAARLIYKSNCTVRQPERIMKTQIDKRGYERVSLMVNGKKETHKVHRLVATSFIPNPDNLPQVNHKDGIKRNNTVENLEWITNHDNQIHAINLGLKVAKTGKQAARFERSVKVIDKDGNLVIILSGNKEMKEFGLDFRLVSACLQGKRKTHKGFTFTK